jgi:hypothetical protein
MPPNDEELADWLGASAQGFWQALRARIEEAYPDTFTPDWSFGGQKHGWGLRYKKSKSFCTLIPERGRMAAMIVFGGAERDKMQPVLPGLSAAFRKAYEAAQTYHDGKWVLFPVDSERDVDDILSALTAKRRPRRPAS